ncbi:MAG: hypothetical protein QXI58_02155 [Candidatus Micrarchaeia archaeon]
MERIYTFSLKESFKKPSTKRGRYAINLLRKLIARHTKQKLENVKIDQSLSNYVTRKFKKPVKKVKIKVIFDEKGAFASLA